MSTSGNANTVLVGGATGRLGRLVDLLIDRGQTVRATTRDVDSPAAHRLRNIGAEVVHADFDDPESIEAAASGIDVFFATGTAHRAGPDGELRHGRNLADAAAAAGVPHLVYSSGDGAAADSPLPLFQAKFQVEERIRSVPIAHTLLAPVYFMENLFNPWNLRALHAGAFPSPLPIDAPLQQLALADLIEFAALVIERPEQFAGLRMSLASDELDARQAAAALSRAVDRPFRAEAVAREELPPPLRDLFAWLEQVGHHVDIDGLRGAYPDVAWHRYGDWARSQLPRFRAAA